MPGSWRVARRHKVVGKFTSLASRTLQPKDYDDATLKDKVESELFRDEHEVKGATTSTRGGCRPAAWRGALEDLIDVLVQKTEKIQGVREVESLLHTPGTEAPMHH